MIGAPVTLALLTIAASPQDTPPPVQGDVLTELIGMHRYNPAVNALLEWMEVPEEQLKISTASYKALAPSSGHGLRLEWGYDRVASIQLTLQGDDTWPGLVPMGLRAGQGTSDFTKAGWAQHPKESMVKTAVASRPFGQGTIEGYELQARFGYDIGLTQLTISLDVMEFWRQYERIVKDTLDIKQFTPENWVQLVGSDITPENAGSAILAWADWDPNIGLPQEPGTFGADLPDSSHRNGLEVHTCDGHWMEQIRFGPEFAGSRPFDLALDVTDAELEARFGPPSVTTEDSKSWTFYRPAAPPFEHHVLPMEIGGRPIHLRCQKGPLRRWYDWTTSRGRVNLRLKREIKQLWERVLTDSAGLKGHAVTQEDGLFGPVTWWHSTAPLGQLIGGTIHESDLMAVTPTRTARYVLRRLAGATLAEADELLAPFEKALRRIPGKDFELTRIAAEGSRMPALEWRQPSDELFPTGPVLAVTANAVPGGVEIVLEARVPME